MKRVAITERPDWKAQAEEFGFNFHTMYGERYWCEDFYYQFGLREIELIEEATEELHQMALKAVDRVVKSEKLLEKFKFRRKAGALFENHGAARNPRFMVVSTLLTMVTAISKCLNIMPIRRLHSTKVHSSSGFGLKIRLRQKTCR